MVSAIKINMGRKTTAMMLIIGTQEPPGAVPARIKRIKLRDRLMKRVTSAPIWLFTQVHRQQPLLRQEGR